MSIAAAFWILDSFDSHKQHTSSFTGIIFHFPTSTRDDNTKQLTQNMVNQRLLIETESFSFHCHSQTPIYFQLRVCSRLSFQKQGLNALRFQNHGFWKGHKTCTNLLFWHKTYLLPTQQIPDMFSPSQNNNHFHYVILIMQNCYFHGKH